jgi:hypothetical protein
MIALADAPLTNGRATVLRNGSVGHVDRRQATRANLPDRRWAGGKAVGTLLRKQH